MREKICLVSGGFDPLHRGHIEYFKAAKDLADYLVVAVNSDHWLSEKKEYYFMPWKERASIIRNLEVVNEVIAFDDSDMSACDAIAQALMISETVIFANGGDRGKSNCPELDLYKDEKRVKWEFGVGGIDKINSSSWLITDFIEKYNQKALPEGFSGITNISSPWGKNVSFLDDKGFKVKQLIVHPNNKLSLQKHRHRTEHWIVVRGQATIEVDEKKFTLEAGEYSYIPLGSKHRLSNESNEDLIIIEVQCGEILEESDIIRFDDNYGRLD